MATSKVVFGNNVLVDLTEDTVTADSLKSGVTAHGANGEEIAGTMKPISTWVSAIRKYVTGFYPNLFLNIELDVQKNSYVSESVGVSISCADFGDANSEDVISGKSFTSSLGTDLVGELVVQKYYTGSSTPSSSLGNNGDIYLMVG